MDCGAFLRNGVLDVHKVVHEHDGPIDDQLSTEFRLKTALDVYDLKIIRKTESFSSALPTELQKSARYNSKSKPHHSDNTGIVSPNEHPDNLEVTNASLGCEILKDTDHTRVTECFFNVSPGLVPEKKPSLVFKEVTKHPKHNSHKRESMAYSRLVTEPTLLTNLPTLIGMGESEKRSVIIMERPRGIELSKIIRDAKRPLKFEILYQLAKALISFLQRLHNAKYLHLDLKPENIIVLFNKLDSGHAASSTSESWSSRFDWSRPVELCVIDYGCSISSMDVEFYHPSEFIPSGTPEYMAPKMVARALAYGHLARLKRAKLSGEAANSTAPRSEPVASFFGTSASNEYPFTKQQSEAYVNAELDRSMDLPSAALTLYAVANGRSFFSTSASKNIYQRVLERFKAETGDDGVESSAFRSTLSALKSNESSHLQFPVWLVSIMETLYSTGHFVKMRQLLGIWETEIFGSKVASTSQSHEAAPSPIPLLPVTNTQTFGSKTNNLHD